MSGSESEHTRRAHREVIRSETAAQCWAQARPRFRGAPRCAARLASGGARGTRRPAAQRNAAQRAGGECSPWSPYAWPPPRSLRTSFSSSSLDEPQSCQGEGKSDQEEQESRPRRGPQTTRHAVGCFVVARKCISSHPCSPRPSSRQRVELFRRVFNTNRKWKRNRITKTIIFISLFECTN
jgi:hypothetical protein